ncbi:DDE superfamily endonuclease [Pristimantis euphronides]
MAVADNNYNFVLVDIGAYGSTLGARVWSLSQTGQRSRNNELHVPGPSLLPGSTNTQVPHVLVADEGFGLSPNVMRPYPKNQRTKEAHFQLSAHTCAPLCGVCLRHSVSKVAHTS